MAQQPTTTADTSTAPTGKSGGGSSWLAFLVGGLLVAVAVIAWVIMSGGQVEQPAVQIPDSVDINVNAPDVPAPSIPDAPSPAPTK